MGASCVSPQEGYKLWAATYDDDPNPLLALEDRELENLLPSLGGKDALDVGCGTGRWLRKLLAHGARSVVGVDFCAPMVGRANSQPALQQRLVLGDCLALPLRAQVADVIVCSFTVGHLSNPRALASELARVARPHAEIFLTDMHPLAQARGWRCAFRSQSRAIEIKSFVHAPEDLQKSFAAEGIKLVQSRDLSLGEPERRIFSRAGKSHIFERACSLPAVLVLHRRLS
jgi:malonyl-CoA O-methyltransferase